MYRKRSLEQLNFNISIGLRSFLDSEDNYRTGCRNVSHPDDHTEQSYEMTPGVKLFTVFRYLVSYLRKKESTSGINPILTFTG